MFSWLLSACGCRMLRVWPSPEKFPAKIGEAKTPILEMVEAREYRTQPAKHCSRTLQHQKPDRLSGFRGNQELGPPGEPRPSPYPPVRRGRRKLVHLFIC
jgi:hypothetical protein